MKQDVADKKSRLQQRLRALRGWFLGLLLLAGLIAIFFHFSEIEHFVSLINQAEPRWLILAAILQAATYLSVAIVWYASLRSGGAYLSLGILVPIGLAKLYSDKALPTAGVSGLAFLLTSLQNRGISTQLCMAVLLLNIVSYYVAYLLVAFAALYLLWRGDAIHAWIVGITIIFCAFAVAVPASVLWMRYWGNKELPQVLLRLPSVRTILNEYRDASGELLRNWRLVASTIVFQALVFLLDAATLWTMLHALGLDFPFWIAFASFVLASMVATISPIPMGLGTFEGTCTGMLDVLGVPLEAALTATLLLRGFTLWLPILPGLWFARRELRTSHTQSGLR